MPGGHYQNHVQEQYENGSKEENNSNRNGGSKFNTANFHPDENRDSSQSE